MLKIVIPASEDYDERAGMFIPHKAVTLSLEHSLVSLSKWESKWCKPFLSRTEKSYEETIDYIRCMNMTPNVDPGVFARVTSENVRDINAYIDAPMTATTFSREDKRGGREIVTAEIIYYWMITMNIPFECQKWHLNRLLTLIRVCSIKSGKPRKMGKAATMNHNRALNAARRKATGSRG